MVITEPVAAALTFGANAAGDNPNERRYIMVYDFGGGTLDCTILELYQRSCNVRTISGDDHLGGQDLDVQILEFVINKWNNME